MNDPYSNDADASAARYESVRFEEVHARWLHLLPERAGGLLALDVGAGSGRDAAALVARGYEVVAVEPSAGMRGEGERRHPSERIHWLNDSLPTLGQTSKLDQRFDLVLLSAAWQQVAPAERPPAIETLAALVAPGGLLVVTLRLGPPDVGRAMHEVDAGEIERLAASAGLDRIPLPEDTCRDLGGREAIRWGLRVFRRP